MPEGYPGLKKHLPSLNLAGDAVVLVPFCGKSNDLIYLSERYDKVIGIEVSDDAIQEFLTDNHLSAATESFAGFTIYQTGNMELWCGDFLKLPGQKFPVIDLIYDKGALAALPPGRRITYAEKILSLTTAGSQILLHHFIYNQDEMNGPPFSVSGKEVRELYGKKFDLHILEDRFLNPERFKKFEKRGLKSGLKERFLHFTPKN